MVVNNEYYFLLIYGHSLLCLLKIKLGVPAIMPQKNKRARHARAQRKDGESKFTTLFQNTTSADYAIDPDYIPSDSEADSDCSDLCEGWAFSMADNNDSEQCGVSDKILKKRKRNGEAGEAAQTIVGHESDVEESGEETDPEVVECTKARDSAKLFWANALDGSVLPGRVL